MIDSGSVGRTEVVSLYEILRSRRGATIALRILAALAVAFAHLDASLGLGGAIGVSLPSTELATLGLIVFFALSGALLSKSAVEQSLGQFTKKRFLRIYPAFFAVMLVTTVLIVPIAWQREHQTLDGLFNFERHGLFEYFLAVIYIPITSPGAFSMLELNPRLPGGLNGSLWTIPIEIQCYALLFLLIKKFPRLLTSRHAIMLPFIVFMSTCTLSILGNSWAAQILTLVSAFLSGAVLSSRGLRYASPSTRAGVLALTLASIGIGYSTGLGIGGLSFGAPILIGVLLLPLGFVKGANIKDISFGLYLWHYPVFQVSSWWRFETTTLAVIALAISLALASLSWRLVESRFLQLSSLANE